MSRFVTSILDTLTQGSFPRVQKAVWKGWYEMMAKKWPDKQWVFMNYGYLPLDDGDALALDESDEADRWFIGQYHNAVRGMDLTGKRVLEVGSGRGGGASYIARYFKPAEMVGLDFSPFAVDLSRQIHQDVKNLTFVEGDAENLPFEDETFDVVVNVESSHCYSNVPAFVAEAERVLKPGGCLTWADMRGRNKVAQAEQAFDRPRLQRTHKEDITPNVVKALDAANEQKLAMVARVPLFKGVFKEFAGMKGSALYNGLKAGEIVYLSMRFEKGA